MKKTMMMVAVAMLGGAATLPARGDTEVVDGITWTYTVSGGEASVGGGENTPAIPRSTTGAITIPSTLGGKPVTIIGAFAFQYCSGLTNVTIPLGVRSLSWHAFYGCSRLTSVTLPSSITSIGGCAFEVCGSLTRVEIPSGVTSIGNYAFKNCTNLQSMTIPPSVTSIGVEAFYNCSGLTSVLFLGAMPDGLDASGLLSCANISYTQRGGSGWIRKFGGINNFKRFGISYLTAEVVSSSIRANDPTILDVVYKVTSDKPTVKVRVLAFEDGVRSFAKVVRPVAFVDGTEANVGDGIAANVEHKISWRVSSDLKTKLAKLKFEVLASEGELLPLELMTIPASDQYGKMKISWNAITDQQLFDALMWLYADGDSGLTLSNGFLKNGSVHLARDTKLVEYTYDWSTYYTKWDYRINAATYIYGKMGYSILTGAPLTYANAETRLGLSPSGARQYAYKVVGD